MEIKSPQKTTGEKRFLQTNLKLLLLKGKKINDWKIIDGVSEIRGKLRYLKCMCVCGKVKNVSYQDLQSGKSKCCIRCSRRDKIIGKVYTYLTVIRCMGKSLGEKLIYECKCKCGNTKKIIATNFMHGRTKSCGCLQKESARQRKMSLEKRYIRCEMCKEKIETYSKQKRFCNSKCANKHGILRRKNE